MRTLQDEALVTYPINTAMGYSWGAINANWKNTIIVALLLIVLSILSLVPIFGFIVSIVQTIILYALGYWIVDRMKESPNLQAFKAEASTANFKSMLFGFFGPAAGFYIGFVILTIIMVIFTIAIFWATGGFEMISTLSERQQQMPNATPEEVYAFYAQIVSGSSPTIAFVTIASLFFSYLWPLVYGYALFQRNFSDALNAVFMFFSKRFWKAAFTGRYFKLVTLWMLILFGIGILTGISIGTVILLPLGILLLIWMVYFTAVVSAQAYNMSDDI